MIPIHFKKPNSLPPEKSHYVVARNGLFFRKRTWWVDATVEVDEIMVLDQEEPGAKLLLPPLPRNVLAKALKLAKAVYDISRSEVCLLLFYDGQGNYQLAVPKQRVSPGNIKYDASLRLPKMLCVGTIHSHGNFPAFHSNTDHEDEQYVDGVHITIGDIGSYPQFSLSAEMVINGTRFPIEFSWFDGLELTGDLLLTLEPALIEWEVPADWLEVVQHPSVKRLRTKKEKNHDN